MRVRAFRCLLAADADVKTLDSPAAEAESDIPRAIEAHHVGGSWPLVARATQLRRRGRR